MCGIIGLFEKADFSKIEQGLKILENRGKDGEGIFKDSKIIFGHRLHAVVGNVKQPLISYDEKGSVKSVLIANCEIYNWKELNEKYKLNAKNDSELILKLIDENLKTNFDMSEMHSISEHDQKSSIFDIRETIELFDGVFAFAYYNVRSGKIYLARDLLGEKPLFYCKKGFASERKALHALGFENINELNPRNILIYDVDKKLEQKPESIRVDFFDTTLLRKGSIQKLEKNEEVAKQNVKELLIKSIKKRIPDSKIKVGVLFSGGVDSTIIAKMLKDLNVDFTCYVSGVHEKADDVVHAKKVAEELGLKLKVVLLNEKIGEENQERIKSKKRDELIEYKQMLDSYLKVIVPLIEDNNAVKVSVAFPFFLAFEEARKDNVKVMFSGLGSEELFAGYKRYRKSLDINKEAIHGLLKLYERDLYRDDVISMYNSIELRTPFLDKDLIKYSLQVDESLKIIKGQKDGQDTFIDKYVLRKVAEELGISIAWRKKKAAQYGSRFDKLIKKLALKENGKSRSDYLKQFYDNGNVPIGVLCSGGKDNLYAAYIMKKQNYDIKCLITIKSKNPDSYMFHTPNIEFVQEQAKAMNVPLVIVESLGEKEIELNDLKRALDIAKQDYKIEGVVSGAIFSNYQRERIEKVCDELSLKIFAPLWHKDQEELIRELIQNKFKVIITKISAQGLKKEILGKQMDEKMLEHLKILNKKYSINVAGEGGETESFVLDMPLFEKELVIEDSEIKQESEHVGHYIIKKVTLKNKN